MEQFSLEKYLENPSRKVVTRSGIEVEIIHDKYPLVAIINGVAYNFDNDGKFQSNKSNHKYDLFFADEELAEFEKAVQSICKNLRDGIDDIGDIHVLSNNLLDLARKEILKDLPKWKKATKHEDLEKHIAILEEGKVLLSNYLEECDYYIELDDLKTLPKEE